MPKVEVKKCKLFAIGLCHVFGAVIAMISQSKARIKS